VTVFLRLLLAIPHIVWIVLWSALVVVAAIFGWLAALLTGRLPGGLHRFFCSYIRYSAHFFGYMTISANPYPAFAGTPGYPIEVELPEAAPLTRWKTFLRIPLLIPALLVGSTLLGTVVTSTKSSSTRSGGGTQTPGGVAVATAFLGWWAAIFTGRMPRGLRDAGAYAIGYRSQLLAYGLLVTERYPNADPTAMLAGLDRPPTHPVHVVGDSADLRRSRITVVFRLPLLVPLLVWLWLWGVLAVLAVIVQWFVTLVAGRPIAAFHRFLSRFVRYAFHVYAFGSLAANAFPGFSGAAGVYPLDLVLPPAGPQNRWKTLGRLVLVVPAYLIEAALLIVLVTDAILMWFVALATGKAPEGLRNLSVYALRYSGQVNAYVFLLTDAYPHASPLEGGDGDDDAEPAGAAAVQAA
jgi:hypothetical protein